MCVVCVCACMHESVRVRVCVCVCARARARAGVRWCAHVSSCGYTDPDLRTITSAGESIRGLILQQLDTSQHHNVLMCSPPRIRVQRSWRVFQVNQIMQIILGHHIINMILFQCCRRPATAEPAVCCNSPGMCVSRSLLAS